MSGYSTGVSNPSLLPNVILARREDADVNMHVSHGEAPDECTSRLKWMSLNDKTTHSSAYTGESVIKLKEERAKEKAQGESSLPLMVFYCCFLSCFLFFWAG